MKNVAFHSNQLGIRGTEVALYDYALYNETILPQQKRKIEYLFSRITDGVIVGNVDLSNLILKELPDLSNIRVDGNYYLTGNNIKTLKCIIV